MNDKGKKSQGNNINAEDKGKWQIKVNERRSNHIIYESKYEKPYSRKEGETEKETKDRLRNLPKNAQQNSAINNQINKISNENPTEKDLNINKENKNDYSAKLSIDTTKNFRRKSEEVKIEKDIQPKWKRNKIATDKEIPKEENVNNSMNNANISKYIKKETKDKNPNLANNSAIKSAKVVYGQSQIGDTTVYLQIETVGCLTLIKFLFQRLP